MSKNFMRTDIPARYQGAALRFLGSLLTNNRSGIFVIPTAAGSWTPALTTQTAQAR
ncbi:MAG: hypothetical protein ACYDEV_07875 [Acidiferrobacter sp.]